MCRCGSKCDPILMCWRVRCQLIHPLGLGPTPPQHMGEMHLFGEKDEGEIFLDKLGSISQYWLLTGTMRHRRAYGDFSLFFAIFFCVLLLSSKSACWVKGGLVYADLGIVRWQNGTLRGPICWFGDAARSSTTGRLDRSPWELCCRLPVKTLGLQLRKAQRKGCAWFRPWGKGGATLGIWRGEMQQGDSGTHSAATSTTATAPHTQCIVL